jgi:hypothetical protein
VQLVQLQQAQARFHEHGLKVAAITYDNGAILKEFAERHHIEYSLMADPQSEIIRRFGIVDPDESPNNLPEFAKKGMALPGFFYVDRKGFVKEKYFGETYYDRFTPGNVIGKLFPELMETAGSPVAAPHLQFVAKQSDADVVVGSRVTLAVEITLPRGVHVYAPGALKYRPTQLVIDSIDEPSLNPELLKASRYPQPKVMLLPAIKERVPVYEGRFRIGQDVVIIPSKEVQQKLKAPDIKPEASVSITIHGKLKYQACDARTCYLPTEAPVAWEMRVHPLDFNRASDAIRDKRN